MQENSVEWISELTQEILNLQAGAHLCLFMKKIPLSRAGPSAFFRMHLPATSSSFTPIRLSKSWEPDFNSGINVGRECERGALKLRREWR